MSAGKQSFDVVVVGGGPAGLSMALSLVAFGDLAVALVDRREFTVPRDSRAFALSAGVRRVLEGLGVWSRIVPEAEPVKRLAITDSGQGDLSRPLFLSFDGDVTPGEVFAHMVPNRVLTAALLDAVAGKVTLIAPAEVAGFVADSSNARLSLGDGRVLEAPLVVAADGAQSALRGMAGIEVFSHDYRQSGIVTTIEHEFDHEGVAYEHFRPAGPFASLPLPNNRSSLVWTESPAEAARLVALPLEEAAREIEAAMGHSLGAVTVSEKLVAFPLKLQMARALTAPRLAMIGDAAHVIHPLAGQGLNLGFKDVAALAESVVEAVRLGLDAGNAEVLSRYAQWRRVDNALMAGVTDGLNRLFSNDSAPLRALRDTGLGLVDRLPPIKGALIREAAGIGRRGPRLLAGLPI